MDFEVYYHPETKDDLKSIPQNIKSRLKEAIINRLVSAPNMYGKPLRGNLKNVWSLRVGDYRVVYLLREKKVVILQVVHRKDAYDAGVIESRRLGIL